MNFEDIEEMSKYLLNNYLLNVVSCSNICTNCVFKHALDEHISFCYFAYECVKDNFSFYKKEIEK